MTETDMCIVVFKVNMVENNHIKLVLMVQIILYNDMYIC